MQSVVAILAALVLAAQCGPAKRPRDDSPERAPSHSRQGFLTYEDVRPGFPLPELAGGPRRLWSWFQPGVHREEVYLAVLLALQYLRYGVVEWLRTNPHQREARVARQAGWILLMNYITIATYARRSWLLPSSLTNEAERAAGDLTHPFLALPNHLFHRHVDASANLHQFDGPGGSSGGSSSSGTSGSAASSPPTRPRSRASQRFDAVR